MATRDEKADLIARLTRTATLAVDNWTITHLDELTYQVTAADRTQLTVNAAIAFLVANNLVQETPEESQPAFLPMDIPEEYQPDIETAKRFLARMNNSVAATAIPTRIYTREGNPDA